MKLPKVVREALFHNTRGKPYYPERYDMDDARSAEEAGYLNADDDGYSPKEGKRSIRDALAVIKNLSDWLDQAPETFTEWYENEADEAPDITTKDFWHHNFPMMLSK